MPGRSGVVNEVLQERAKSRRKTRDVRFWEERLNFARRVAEPYLDEYGKNLDYYVGKQQPVYESQRATRGMVPNLAMENMLVVNRILPSLASQNAQIMWRVPWWQVTSRRPMTGPNDETYRDNAEYLLNFALRAPKNDILLNMRLCLLGAELAYGALKVTWTPDEGLDPEEGKEELLGQMVIEQDQETGQQTIDIKGGVPKVDPVTRRPIKRGRDKFVIDQRQIGDYLRVDWKDWRDLVHDPEGANSFYDHLWIAERMSWSYEDFMANKMFGNKEDIENAAHFVDEDYSGNWKDLRLYRTDRTYGRRSQPGYLQRDRMRIWGHQIWDLEKRRTLYMVDGFDKLVADEPIPGWIDFAPYSFTKFNEVPGEWWHYPDVTPARPLAADYNISRSQVFNHRRRFNRKYEILKGKIKSDELEKLKNPDDGTLVESTQLGSIQPIQDARLDDAVYRDMDRAIMDMSEIVGSSPEARGSSQSDTATQAAIIERHGTSRENDKRSIMARTMGHVGRMALNALQANLDEPIAVNILGPQGQRWQHYIGQADIVGDYDTEVDVIELEPHDKQTDRADLLTLMQILGPEVVLQSPTMLKRLLTSFRQYDPAAVAELHEIGVMMQMRQMMGASAQGGAGGKEKGGPKPPGRGPEEGAAGEGRSYGRALRRDTMSGNATAPPSGGNGGGR